MKRDNNSVLIVWLCMVELKYTNTMINIARDFWCYVHIYFLNIFVHFPYSLNVLCMLPTSMNFPSSTHPVVSPPPISILPFSPAPVSPNIHIHTKHIKNYTQTLYFTNQYMCTFPKGVKHSYHCKEKSWLLVWGKVFYVVFCVLTPCNNNAEENVCVFLWWIFCRFVILCCCYKYISLTLSPSHLNVSSPTHNILWYFQIIISLHKKIDAHKFS